jgi:hypothetical protein
VVVLALWRLKQEDHVFGTSLADLARPCLQKPGRMKTGVGKTKKHSVLVVRPLTAASAPKPKAPRGLSHHYFTSQDRSRQFWKASLQVSKHGPRSGSAVTL